MINSIQPINFMQNVNQNIPFHTNLGEEILSTSPALMLLSEEDQKRVDALNKELGEIFGSPKGNLTDAEKQKENELMNAIDKILKKTEPEALTKAQEDQLDSIYKEIGQLFEDGELTADEEKKLTTLEESIDKLFKPKILSDADQKELDQLFDALDKLYGIKQPSKEELARAEEINSELDKIYTKYVENPDIQSILGDDVSKENLDKVTELLTEIQDTLGHGIDLPNLSDEDQKAVDAINKQIDELLGVNTLTDAQQENADKINQQIEALFEDGVITAEEEITLTKLDKQLEELYGKPKELSTADNEKLEELFSQLDKIYEKQTPAPKENDKLTKLTQELEDLLVKIFPDKDATEIDNLMNELQSFGPLAVIDGDDAVPFGDFGVDSFLISELGNLRIEDFSPNEGDVLRFDKSLGLESKEHLNSLISELTQEGEDLVVDFASDDASITLAGVSLEEISWDNVVL